MSSNADIPDGIGPGYTYKVINLGHCVVPGCTTEALSFCDEHSPEQPMKEPRPLIDQDKTPAEVVDEVLGADL